MAFNYAKLNPEIVTAWPELFKRPVTEWTAEEVTKVLLTLEAIRMAIAQRKEPSDV